MRQYGVIAGAVALGGMGLAAWYWLGAPAAAQTPPPAPAAIPVQAATATNADVPIYETGLGNVQAFNTVTVKVRVDGELQKVDFTEGQMVKAGDLLAQIDPRPFQAALDQAIAKEAQDQAQLANTRLNLQRDSNLVAHQFATQQAVDNEKAQVAELEAAIKGDEAAIESARVQLSYTTITAPIAGRTGIRLVDQGNIVHATDTTGIVVVTQLQPISVIFTLPEEDLPAIADAQAKGTVTVTALNTGDKRVLDQGTLALVDNEIDQTTGTMRLKATFPNPHNRLWPGQFVNIRLLLRTDRDVLTVPSGAIQRSASGLYVYRIAPDNTVEAQPVEVGPFGDDVAVVTAGLHAGDRVVTAGQYRLQPGAHVAVTAAAKPKAEQIAEAGQ
ncbi:MAG TPA: efflux RND transporter periplasmic adaptor subunit [Stellaceae bacterium]|nr:efflux RND transporter periplasmic adaptor subunit [Stellaceae bacterium]